MVVTKTLYSDHQDTGWSNTESQKAGSQPLNTREKMIAMTSPMTSPKWRHRRQRRRRGRRGRRGWRGSGRDCGGGREHGPGPPRPPPPPPPPSPHGRQPTPGQRYQVKKNKNRPPRRAGHLGFAVLQRGSKVTSRPGHSCYKYSLFLEHAC